MQQQQARTDVKYFSRRCIANMWEWPLGQGQAISFFSYRFIYFFLFRKGSRFFFLQPLKISEAVDKSRYARTRLFTSLYIVPCVCTFIHNEIRRKKKTKNFLKSKRLNKYCGDCVIRFCRPNKFSSTDLPWTFFLIPFKNKKKKL